MRLFLAFIFVSLSWQSLAQGFRARHFLPGIQNHTAKAIFESSPGNYITGGIIVDSVNGVYSNRLCLMGLDNQGQIQWVKKYGDSKFEYLDNNYIARSYYKQGNYLYYTGCVRDSTEYVGVLVKFDLNGDTLWQKIYRDTAEDVVPQMATAGVDGSFLITGFFQNWNTNTRPCLLIKTDINGNEIWRKKIHKVVPNVSDGKAIVQDSASKKIIILGYQYIGNATSAGSYDNVLFLDSLGVKLSQHSYAGFGGGLFDILQTKDNKLIAVGQRRKNTVGPVDYYQSFAVKFDANTPGISIWLKTFEVFSSQNAFNCVNEYDNGDLLFSGNLDTLQPFGLLEKIRIKFRRTDKDGNTLWNRYHDYASANSQFYFASITSASIGSDNCILASIGLYNPPNPNPLFFVKYDSLGCDTSSAYCQMIASGIGKNYVGESEISIYPNPGNGLYYFHSPGLNEKAELKVTISDLSGRMIKELSFSGYEKQPIDLKDLSNGVYLITISRQKEILYKSKLIKE